MKFIKREIKDTIVLLRNIPSLVFSLFVISLIAMNLLANKSVNLKYDFLVFDCGIIISWIAFLTNDVITKHFGPKAAIKVSIVGIIINLLICLLFYLASLIPGVWSECFLDGSEDVINNALNKTIGGTWYVVLGSTIAFILAIIVNNICNYLIGKLVKKNNFLTFALRSYISTFISQFVDNFIFSLLVSHIFFGWTILECVYAAIFGMLLELICEIIFSPIGYKICKRWDKLGIGEEYKKGCDNNEGISDRG